MLWEDLTPEQQNVLRRYTLTLRDWCEVRIQLTKVGEGIRDRSHADITTIISLLDPTAVIGDGATQQGGGEITRADVEQITGFVGTDVNANDETVVMQKLEEVSGRSIRPGAFNLPG